MVLTSKVQSFSRSSLAEFARRSWILHLNLSESIVKGHGNLCISTGVILFCRLERNSNISIDYFDFIVGCASVLPVLSPIMPLMGHVESANQVLGLTAHTACVQLAGIQCRGLKTPSSTSAPAHTTITAPTSRGPVSLVWTLASLFACSCIFPPAWSRPKMQPTVTEKSCSRSPAPPEQLQDAILLAALPANCRLRFPAKLVRNRSPLHVWSTDLASLDFKSS
jgi:hypothetical protein